MGPPEETRAMLPGELVVFARAEAWRKVCSRQTKPLRVERMQDLCDRYGRSMSLLISWSGNSQYRFTAYVLQRPIHSVRAGIDRDRVRIRSQEAFKDFLQSAILFIKDCYVPALG